MPLLLAPLLYALGGLPNPLALTALLLITAAQFVLARRVLTAAQVSVPGGLHLLPVIGLVLVGVSALLARDVTTLSLGAGTVLGLGGAWLSLAAVTHLGRHFQAGTQPGDAHALITTGPYRWVRHPKYVGAFLSQAGVAALIGHPLALAGLAVMLAGYVWRVRAEEAVLARTYGPVWTDYATRSARLVPLLY